MAFALATAIMTLPLALAAVTPGLPVQTVPLQASTRPVRQVVAFNLPQNGPAELSRSPDGLFYLDALVNGVPVRFLVDTGANAVVLAPDDARRAGIKPEFSSVDELAQTAGGRVAMVRVRLRSLEAGPMRRDNVDVAVADSRLSVSLLGQSWLSQLGSVTIVGDRMVLQ